MLRNHAYRVQADGEEAGNAIVTIRLKDVSPKARDPLVLLEKRLSEIRVQET